MTISRVNGATWGVGDNLTSTQANGLDLNTTYALDKRAAQTDTLASVVSLSGSGRVIDTVVTGADADTTYVVDAANRVIRVTSAVTANRIYVLSATGAVTGDQLTIFCEPSFVTYEITVKDQALAAMYSIGNLVSSQGHWATFIYIGGWRLFRYSTKNQIRTYTASDTLVVPSGVIQMTFEGVGGGGGGGGGRGAGGNGDCSAAGGGGARRGKFVKTVIPGETLTIVCGAGGGGGAGGSSGGSTPGAGVHGVESTVTGSGSGLLATFYGAQGAIYATNTPGFYMGGMPVRWNIASATHTYPRNSASPLTTVGGDYPGYPIPGQGGFAGTVAEVSSKTGGSTAYAQGNATSTVDGTYAGSGGASEWAGGDGGTGGGAVNSGVHSGNGGNGVFGSGGGGGAGGWTTPTAGGNGGNGGDGVVQVTWEVK